RENIDPIALPMSNLRRCKRFLRPVLHIFFPEILAVDQLDREPKPTMPRMIVRLENAQAMPGRRGERMKKGLGFAAVHIFPKRQLAVWVDQRDGLAQIMLEAHENRIRSRRNNASRCWCIMGGSW